MNIKVTINTEETIIIKTLTVEAEVRYWDDATVNGIKDEKGDLIPCRDGDLWKPIIDIETGKITNWTRGVEAVLHYKVCGKGLYEILDNTGKKVLIREGYVPDIMCPKEEGYGDYIKMDIAIDGQIKDWKIDLADFM